MKRILSMAFLTVLVAGTALAQSDHDRRFADSMTKHHRDGIEMARLSVQKSASEELRTMARKMIEDQQRDIDRMQALRGSDPQTPMERIEQMPGMMPAAEMQRDLARLQSVTGREFDIAFTEIMPKHHAGAITMSEDEIRNGELAAMKDVAREIATKQSEERSRMLAMHEQWTAAEPAPAREVEAEPEASEPPPAERTRLRKD